MSHLDTGSNRERTIRPRRGDLEAATTPHPFQPSGEFAVAPSRAEVCDLCGLAQRGDGTMHPPALGATA